MTKESYERGKHLMRIASNTLGNITKTQEQVAKWTELEAYYVRVGKPIRAANAKVNLEKSIFTLERLKQKFDELTFPESNIVVVNKKEPLCQD